MECKPHSALSGEGLEVHFGGIRALDGIDVVLEQGEILGLIGPNGAGKTTLVNVLSGFQAPTAGRVAIGRRDVTKLPPHQRARLGLGRTFQGVRLFSGVTVEHNVVLAAVAGGERPRRAAARAMELLSLARLTHRAGVLADALTHGEQRRLGLVRALAAGPRQILLDEPAAGLNERESEELGLFLASTRSDLDCSFLLIEHDMSLVMSLCDRVQVLDYGKTLAIGRPREIAENPKVIEAYLGASH